MKKLVIGGLLFLLVVGALAAFAFAENATTTPAPAPAKGQAGTRPEPTEKQKAELTELQNQMLAVREKLIDKYAEYGWISRDQANYAKERIQLSKKYAGTLGDRGYGRGSGAGAGCQGDAGMMGGRGGGRGMMGYGMMGW